jgi:hypothetical protein
VKLAKRKLLVTKNKQIKHLRMRFFMIKQN